MSEAKSNDDENPPSSKAPNSAPPSSRAPNSAPPSSRAPSSAPPSSDGLGFSEAEAVSERRGDYRHLACFPGQLHTPEGVLRTALIRDLSVSGALLLTRASYRAGDPIRLSLYLAEGDEPTLVDGKVVRSSRREGELSVPWTRSVAVRFDRTVAELEPMVKALADKQAALFAAKKS